MVKLMMDVHVPRQIAIGLRIRGIDVLTAQEDSATTLSDPDLLDRATSLERVLVSQDEDLLIEAARRQAYGEVFAGLVYADQLDANIGQMVNDLFLVCHVFDANDMYNYVQYLPL